MGPVRDEVTGEWRIRHNRELRELTLLPPVTSHVRAQRLRWAGHVARMDPTCFLRQVFDGTPEGRRPPGRPRLRWTDCIVKDLEMLGVDNPRNWRETAQDRSRWRLLVVAARDQIDPPLQE